jgi:hypothetical protein
MSALPPPFPSARSQPPGLDPYRVRVSDPGEVAAAVPQLLGFRPRESVVLIGLGGVRGGATSHRPDRGRLSLGH